MHETDRRVPTPTHRVLLTLCLCIVGCEKPPSLATSGSSAEGSAPAASQNLPNIIVIIADDLATRSLGFDGNQEVRTPHLDRLALEGMVFSRTYVTIPQCAPSRAAMLTGRHAFDVGVVSNTRRKLSPDALTVAEALQPLGYRCGMIGKWHNGNDKIPQRGFEDYWVTWQRDETGFREKYLRPALLVNGKVKRFDRYLTDVLTDHAIEFVDQDRQRPFLLWLAYFAPHDPLTPHPDERFHYDPDSLELPVSIDDDLATKPVRQRRMRGHRDLPKVGESGVRRMRAAYYSMISALDANVGRLMDHLKSAGLDENTLVIFTSDNGRPLGEHQLIYKGPMFYEELVRVPLVLRWPGRVPAGANSRALVSLIDLFPTIVQCAGLKAPAQVTGRDLWPLIEGRVDRIRDEVFIHYSQQFEPRVDSPMLGVVRGRYKYVRYLHSAQEEWYDLHDDPYEMKNLAVPEASQSKSLQDLRARVAAFARQIDEPFWDQYRYQP